MATNALKPGEQYISFKRSPSPLPPHAESSSAAKRKASDTPIPGEKAKKKKAKNNKSKSKKGPKQAEPEKSKKDQKELANKQKKNKEAKERRQAAAKGKAGVGIERGPRNKKEEQKAAERHAPWTELVDVDRCQDPTDLLTEEINAFYKYVSPTKEEFEVRLFIIELITRAIARLWPEAEVTPFGSWQTQLYLPQGDIDLVVTHKEMSDANKARLLAELGKAMRQTGITDTVAIIAKARVPIIKFVTLDGRINVDISLNQANGVTAGKIINQYLDALPGSRQLILVAKSFLSQRSMNEVYTGGLGSYSVICLVISFLQVHPKLRRGELNPELNLGTLLIEFFELYGRNFNYNDVGLSIRRGGFYFSKSDRGWMRNQSFLLSIEDPQDKDNDISGGSFGIRQVRNTLAGAYELLCMRLFQRAEDMAQVRRVHGGKGRVRAPWQDMDGDDWSILGGVMGITKETLKQRAEMLRIHSQSILHRKLNIPPAADPSLYVKHYRPPPVISVPSVYARKASPPREFVGGASSKGKGKGKDVGAIMVEDDEVSEGSGSGSSSSDDSDDSGSDDSDSDAPIAISPPRPSNQRRHLPGAEEGEIIEIPQIRRTLGSDEPSEDDFEVINDPPEESRYALSKTKDKSNGSRGKKIDAFSHPLPAEGQVDEEEEDSDAEALRKIMEGNDSDIDFGSEDEVAGGKDLMGAIEVSSGDEVNSKPEGKKRKPRHKKARQQGQLQQQQKARMDKQAFWAAKGRMGAGSRGATAEEWSD
ncbi:hypothetical protein L202_05911 [Cryptococcus amylolentus CBS 6039]|uniref:polynucleotide adenylyltransferase n=2 Tax=Cryptococcus amylolentus TaxID=104669 RepID=A0A1E3HJM5_9TREE|nr:hypothetical protein L202_05911 [Cryptococcus amylolentus CBS 6039]ODN75926.1 hypothetical protein L202_05911 [Cryptococcus amylolentus CBS 6039]ODN97068.1 hypothetical protein I350_08048 [Cryptococcus amylolentus CBS 6273]